MFTQKLRVMFVIGIMFIAFTACGDDSSQDPPLTTYPQTLTGYTDCNWGDPECNPPAKSVQDQITNLRSFGEFLGFFMNKSPDVSVSHHWQGIQRYSTISDSGSYTDFLVLTRSNADWSTTDDTPDIYIVAMDSRNASETEGERYRSNRLCPANTDIYDSPPDMCPFVDPVHMERDKVVQWKNVQPSFKHAGGFQLIGKYAAIPFEKSNIDDNKYGRASIVDISNGKTDRDSLRVLYTVVSEGDEGIGTVAIGKLMDERYLLILGTGNCDILRFYISEGTSLETSPSFQYAGSILFSDHPAHAAYQNTSLVTEQGTGDLYLICTYNFDDLTLSDENYVTLWKLTITEDVDDEQNFSYAFEVEHLTLIQVHSRWGTNSQQCNLNAAAGAYVDPHGHIIIYATEHDNDGPCGSVKMMEFRSFLPKYNPPVDCIEKSWVEIYDDSDVKDDPHRSNRDRSLMIDYRDRNLRNYPDFDDVDGFGDKASSVRWNIHSGIIGVMYEDHSYGGDTCGLSGQGHYSNLSDEPIGNDKVSSFKFLP